MIEPQKIVTVGSLPGQIFQQLPDSDTRVPDGRNIVQGASGIKLEDIGGRVIQKTKAEIAVMKNPNPNLIYRTFDNNYPQDWVYPVNDQTGVDDYGTVLATADDKLLKSYADINGPVNILAFGAVPSTICTSAFKKAIENAPVGRIVFIPSLQGGKSFYIDDMITISTYLKITSNLYSIGAAYVSGTIRYVGGANKTVFKVTASRVTIENIGITTTASYPGYTNFIGIEQTNGSGTIFKNICIGNAAIGIYVNPVDGGISFTDIIKPSVVACGEGVKVVTGNNYSTGIHIINPYARSCGKGLNLGGGIGNSCEFDACEVGNNVGTDVELSGGNWRLRGSSWGEGTPIGIVATGGFHTIEGDIKAGSCIKEAGGTIICNSPQTFTDAPRKSANYRDCKFWFSFDEQSGDKAYSRVGDKYISLSSSEWASGGQFDTSLKCNAGTGVTDALKINDTSDIDLSKDWTLLMLQRNDGTNEKSISFGASGGASLLLSSFKYQTKAYVNSASGGLNVFCMPAVDYFTDFGWTIIIYDSVNKVLRGLTSSGYLRDNSSIPADFSTIGATSIVLGLPSGVAGSSGFDSTNSFDEVIFYSRILDPKEICAITHLPFLGKNKIPNSEIIDTAIISDQTNATLNAAYPNAVAGQKIVCPNITGGAQKYTLYDAANKLWLAENIQLLS